MYTTILWDGDIEVERVTGFATHREAEQIGERHILSLSDEDDDADVGPFFTIIEEK
jgi:hypothetical protein